MAFENFPTVFQDIFQQNMLARRFEDQLKALCAYRKTAFRLPVPIRSGESITYSRAGRISPVLSDLTPSLNTGLDNGVTGIGGVGAANPTYPFEQWSVFIGMRPYFLDLNLVQAKEVIADIFKQNQDNLVENAALSLDLQAMNVAFDAYLGGSTYIKSGSGTSYIVDNAKGLDTAFATTTIGGNTFPTGAPAPVSVSNPLSVVITHDDGTTEVNTITGVTPEGTNHAVENYAGSGAYSATLTLGTTATLTAGWTIKAADGPAIYRPNGKPNVSKLTATDTIGAQLIINAVAELRANGVKSPLADNTYPCYIDPIVDAQFFTDPQYQIMSQGTVDSPEFKGARVNKNFGVTFVPTTNSPAFTASAGVVARHAIVTGEKYLQMSPFAGTEEAIRSMPDMGVQKFDIVDDIVFVQRMPLDRAGQILSSGWYWIGGYAAPTDATITSAVLPSASAARNKRAVVVQVASAR